MNMLVFDIQRESAILTPLRDDDTLRLAPGVLDRRAQSVAGARAGVNIHGVLQTFDSITEDPRLARILRPADQLAQRQQWIHQIAPGLSIEKRLHLRELLRILLGEIGRLAIVLIQVVELPRMRISVEQLVFLITGRANPVP